MPVGPCRFGAPAVGVRQRRRLVVGACSGGASCSWRGLRHQLRLQPLTTAVSSRLLVQMAGHGGSGKSTLARGLADRLGAVVVDLDTIKSTLLDAGASWSDASSWSYELIYALVDDALATAGSRVVVDTPSYWPQIHERLTTLADTCGAAYVFVECEARETVRAERLATRPRRRSQVRALGVDSVDAPRGQDPVHQRPIRRPSGRRCVVVATDGPVDVDELVATIASDTWSSALRLVVVSGWTAAGKSTLADGLAPTLSATVVSFDWVMSAVRSFPDLWAHVELPVERQRELGWELMSRVAEQQLRRGSSVVLDLVARDAAIERFRLLADRYAASMSVIECVCSDEDVHRGRVEGRSRDIPGWYELTWEHVQRTRAGYRPLAVEPKLTLDAVHPAADNLATALSHLLVAVGG